MTQMLQADDRGRVTISALRNELLRVTQIEEGTYTIEVTYPLTRAERDLLSVDGATDRLVEALARPTTPSAPRRPRRDRSQ